MTAVPKAPESTEPQATPAAKAKPTAKAKPKAKATPAKKQAPKATPAKEAPKAKADLKPVPLKDVKPTEDARLFLAGRRGHWLGRLVKHDAATLTFRCKWHANDKEVKVDRADVAKLEVKRNKAYVLVTL